MNELELNETQYFCSYLKRSFFKVNTFTSFENKIDVLVGILLMASKDYLEFKDKKNTQVLYKDIWDYIYFLKEDVMFENYNFTLFETLKEDDFNNIITFKYELKFNEEKPVIDYLGLAYQYILNEYRKGTLQMQCSYYTSIDTLNYIISEYFECCDIYGIYDPFCGAGRQLFNDAGYYIEGSDLDKIAVDIANLNHFIINPDNTLRRFQVKDFYNLTDKKDYILTNIPFDKSIKKEAEIVNKLAEMTNIRCVAIIPAGHYERMVDKNLISKDWKLIDKLKVEEFEPFTKIVTEVILIDK